MDEVKVSVLCVTYNHASYISECLDSLISQKTSFPYEVIVFDDASNDGTSDILRSYANRYPNIVIPVINSENLYSKGLEVSSGFLDLARGDFVAFCEGDDYWISENKLQLQYEYMITHSDCLLHTHGVAEFDDSKKRYLGVRKILQEEGDVDLNSILFKFTSFGTNSMMYRREFFILPSAFCNWGVGDYPRFICAALNGIVHYSPEVLSAYRVNVPGSWTSRNKSLSNKAATVEKIIRGLRAADEYSSFIYHDSFERAIYLQKRDYLLAKKDWQELTKGDTASYYQEDTFENKVIAWARCFLPKFVVQTLIEARKRYSLKPEQTWYVP